jgi:outer membrane receptor protein involved in Fe transport
LPDPHWLLPASENHSVFASGGVEMTPQASFDFDIYYNRRDSEGSTSIETFQSIRNIQSVEVEQYGAVGGLHVDVTSDWAGDISLTYSRSTHSAFKTSEIADSSDDAASEIASIDASLGGPMLHITDEPIELVLGAHVRAETAEMVTVTSNGFFDEIDKGRRVASGVFELYAPLIGNNDGVPGVHRFALTAAARYDDYDDVGSSFNPRFGLTWSPLEGLNLRGAWGTAFRAPRLEQLRNIYSAVLGVYDDPAAPSGESVALLLAGSTADLSPEEAETWAAGLDFEPVWLEGLRLRTTYFNVAYDGRVGFPTSNLTAAFHVANFTGIPVRGQSAAQVQALADNAQQFLNLGDILPVGPLALADVSVILDGRAQNLSSSAVEGVDFEASYSSGDWTIFLNGTYLLEFTQQVTPTTQAADLLNTFANPIDLRLRGGVSWATEQLTVALFVNHVAGYTDNASTDPTFDIDSWTTFDASLHFNLGRFFGGDGHDREAFVTFTIENLLDEDPPRIGPRVFRTNVYDNANADPSGRRIGVLLSKRW